MKKESCLNGGLFIAYVNSAPRKEVGGETPYRLALKKYGPEILEALQLKYVAPDDVILSPKLLKYNH